MAPFRRGPVERGADARGRGPAPLQARGVRGVIWPRGRPRTAADLAVIAGLVILALVPWLLLYALASWAWRAW